MAAKEKPLSDVELLSLVESAVKAGTTWVDGELQKERRDVLEYYDGDRPYPNHKGNSKYVSLDVYDTVEAVKATLLETFSAGTGIGTFDPEGPDDVEQCQIATTYVDYVMFRQNPLEEIIEDALFDGLTARIGVAKSWWRKQIDEIEIEFEDYTEEEVMALVSADDMELRDLEYMKSDDPLRVENRYKGVAIRRDNKSQVVIEAIPPEDFIASPRAKSAKRATLTHRMRLTRSDLRKLGIDKKAVEEIEADTEVWVTDPDLMARHDASDGSPLDRDGAGQEATQRIIAYETYIELDPDNTGIAKLYKVLWATGHLLDKEQVTEHPFHIYCPLRRPHALHGTNYAKKIFATQNAKTTLTRGIIDHTVLTNNPRFQVLNGALPNPSELMEGRMGGIVNVKRENGVRPLEQAPLNPFVFQTVQLLDYDLEDTSGVSKLSQGLNKDAVSKQNSQAMVEQLTTNSMQRQKIMARRFAVFFLKDLYRRVYQLVVENEDRTRIIEVAGKWVEVDPRTWRQQRDFQVSLHLGYGEKERQAQELTLIDQYLSQTPFYDMKRRYNVLKRTLEYKGYKDVNNFLMPPEEVQPPPPPPELVLAQKELELKAAELKAKVDKNNQDHEYRMAQLELQRLSLQSEHAIAADRVDIEDRAQKHDEKMDEAELQLAREAPALGGEVRGIASP